MVVLGTGNTPHGNVKPSSLEQSVYERDLQASRSTDIPNNLKKRMDYVARTDGNPVYVGFAPIGLAEGVSEWLIYKLTYDASNRVTEVNVAFGDWTNHSTLTYS
jgi:hypothetical protein